MTEYLLPAAFGFGAGILSAWGIGGGTLLLLCMTLFLDVEQSLAQQINLLFFLPTALLSLPAHRKNGYLKPQILRAAIPAGIAGAVAGALLLGAVDIALLRKPFGIFLLAAGILTIFSKKPSQDPPKKK